MNEALKNILNDMTVEIEEEEKQEKIEKKEKDSHVKILLIGCGYWGKNWLKTIIENSPYNIYGVVDIKPAENNGDQIRQWANLENVPKEFTHAIIATPAETHLEIYKTLKEKFNLDDKNILIEKPVGINYVQAYEMKDCVHDFIWLYDDNYEILKEKINSIGKPLRFESVRASMGPRIRTDVSIIEDYLFHDLYIYKDLFEISAPVVNDANLYSYFKPPIMESTIDLTLNDANLYPLTAKMFSSWWYPKKDRKVIVIGTRASIIWENDKIFINRSHYYEQDKEFIDTHGNKGYELKQAPVFEVEPDYEQQKLQHIPTNLEKLLDAFVNKHTKKTDTLLLNTWKLIEQIKMRGSSKIT
ncbi:MAG: oxidoreductase [Ignavibacteriaceae bacterium]|jgi:predicted dehydrogenase|nr:MAG: oxidoreductase [Ignavibacteriaceae bacterium]